MEEVIYLDWNATTPIHPLVRTEIIRMIDQNTPLNPSSIHKYGTTGKRIIDTSSEIILNSLRCNDKYNIIFTSSGTESNNQIINTFRHQKIAISRIEHVSILEPGKVSGASMIGCNNDGTIELESIEQIIRHFDSGFLVSVIHANNETGVIQDIKSIAKLVHKYGGFIHSDLSQSLGKIDINIFDLDIDYATISSHKICGPHGIAGLVYRNGLKISPLILGGGQAKGLRSGTENVLLIKAFAKACSILQLLLSYQDHIESLRNIIEETIDDTNLGKTIKCPSRLPNTIMITMHNISNMAQLMYFDMHHLIVSNGSACSSGKTHPSHVLQAMGLPDDVISNTIRVSLGYLNTKKDVESFIDKWTNLARTR